MSGTNLLFSELASCPHLKDVSNLICTNVRADVDVDEKGYLEGPECLVNA